MHYLLIVDGYLPNCSANHLLVRLFSTDTTLIRFKSLCYSRIIYCAFLYIFVKITKKKNINSI